MRTRKVIFLILMVLLSISIMADERLFVYQPVKFSYVGSQKVENWYWCKTEGARIEWTWNPVHNIPSVFYVNYVLLQTNKVNGGSGFDSQIKAALIIEEVRTEVKIIGYESPPTHWHPVPILKVEKIRYHQKIAEGVLKVVNTFRPIYEEDSQGIGYEVRGYVNFKVPKVHLESLRQHQFKIVIYWPPLNNEYPFAASPSVKPMLVFKK